MINEKAIFVNLHEHGTNLYEIKIYFFVQNSSFRLFATEN